jgi:hypothetical protein
MKVLLILPAGENARVTRDRPRVPKRAMLRFSVLPLTTVAALAHEASCCGLLTVGWMPALFGVKLGLTYRRDNKREGIVGWNPLKGVAAGECEIYKCRKKPAFAGG